MVVLGTLVTNTFRKFQLKAEIALVEREETNRQRAFGVELYDLIDAQRTKIRKQIAEDENLKDNADSVEQVLKVFQTIENGIREPLEACRNEVQEMEASVPKFPPILIQRRKEEFGITIWPIVSEPQWLHESLEKDLSRAMATTPDQDKTLGNLMNQAVKGVVKGTKSTITKAIGKLSPEEREVEACVDKAKRDISLLEAAKAEKFTEIEDLISGGSTLECC